MIFEAIKEWYNGTYIPFKNDPNSNTVIIGGYTEYHWTAQLLHKILDFYLEHWKWCWSTGIAIVGLTIAIIKLGS